MSRLKVGVLGCGAISKIYLTNLTGKFADRVEVVAVADVLPDSAKAKAEEHKIPLALTPQQLLDDRSVQLVLNLTPAPAHFDVSSQILRAGKHLYSEKPLALTLDQGRQLVDLATSRHLRLAVAPDTLLGAGVQTCCQLVRDGAIGRPVAGYGFVSIGARGERYFTVFRGPLLDLGPYHVGALLAMLGPVKSVTGIAHPITDTPDKPLPDAAKIVDAPGHSAAVLEFASGCLVTLICTAEHQAYAPHLRLWGASATLNCPDPNSFGGVVSLQPPYKPAEEVPHRFDFAENSRGIGVWDMAQALAENRPHRLGPDLALHSLEVMLAVIESQKTARRIDLTTTVSPFVLMPALPPPPPPASPAV